MTNDNKLYIPIQINGGEDIPDNLLDRELYLCTTDMKIYVKSSEDAYPKPINAAQSDIIKGDYFELYSATGNQSTIGKFYVDESGLKGDNIKGIYPTISDFNINQLKSMVLNADMYGTTLPEDGTEGQLFFKI